MDLLAFSNYPLWLLGGVFVVSALAVWVAGTRLSRYASIISDRTGAGQAFIGLLLLAGVTSLPELATSVTAAASANAALAVNNLLGGVAMQVAVLVVADMVLGSAALTATVPRPAVLLQMALSVVLLAFVTAGITAGEVAVFGVGAWSTAVMAGYVATLWLSQREERVVWVPKKRGERQPARQKRNHGGKRSRSEAPLGRVVLKIVVASAVILVAGFLLTRTGESIAERTGLGASFFGMVFLAIATSLPELSSVIAAVRLRQIEMAIGDVLGGNLIDIALVFVVDAVYAGAPVLSEVGQFSAFGALLGIVLTSLYIAGLIERRNRTILRMGYDSLAVIVCYLGGLAILYTLR